MNLQENIQRIKQVMGLNEWTEDMLIRYGHIKLDNPYKDKTYNPENTGDFSDSKIKKVVWRAGSVKVNPQMGGIWFGEDKEGVEKFVRSVRKVEKEGRPYYINLQNPKYYDNFWYGYLRDAENYGRETLMNKLIRDGHDGIVIGRDTWNDTGNNETSVTSEQYVVFNPENVKPA